MRSRQIPAVFERYVSADGTRASLGYRNLTTLPTWIGHLTALRELDLHGNQLMRLPRWLGSLTALTTLNLSGNQLTRVPEPLRQLTGLTTLNLSGNQLRSVPRWLGDLTALTALLVTDNELTRVPGSLRQLTALTRLNLGGNRLDRVPASLRHMTGLTELNLSDNQIAEVPGWLGSLTALTTLYLHGNQIAAIPASVGSLTGLTTLSLSGNRLVELPGSLRRLTALSDLFLYRNELTELPESLGELTGLTALFLRGNRLTGVPAWLGGLTALEHLDLGDNELAEVPDSLCDLAGLRELVLRGNRLTEIPGSLGKLPALEHLDLSRNLLTALPMGLADPLADGLELDLDENPLTDPLPQLAQRGPGALATYLRSLEDATPQYEAKLLLVGEGNVGKTSLVAELRGDEFVEGRPTTHGIEISPLTFRHPTRDADLTLRAWDFGGQRVYQVTHQFFFSRRGLYLVVWNARESPEQDQVAGWLRRIRLRVGDGARTMLVATHCEERFPELDYEQLRQAFPEMLAGSFEVDSRTGSGFPRLREALGQQAARLPQMGQLISPRWAAAREEILARADAEPQIRYRQFAEACERHGVTGPEIVTLAQLMHDLGQVIYYGEDEGLRDVVVLNPEWLTKAISYVLEDRKTREAGGVLAHTWLREIWPDRPDGPSYPARYHPYFLRLMEKFDISYRLDGDELHSLVAQLVPHERPALPWPQQPPPGVRRLTMVCRLSEPVPGLIPWLTVRHHRASAGLHWRHGVFLRHPIAEYASEALLELSYSGELSVEVRAPSPDLFFNTLRYSIEDLITSRWPGLSYQLLIACQQLACPGLFPLNGLIRLRERGHATYPCIDCSGVYEISELLTGFAAPRQTLAAELGEIRDQLTQIEDGVREVAGRAADAAESVRRVLRVVSTEITDCPRLFTLAREHRSLARAGRFHQLHYRLTLWCEHPGCWHPWDLASYAVDPPRDWFVKIAPYATLIFRMLQLAFPLAGDVAGVLLPPEQMARAYGDLTLMGTVIADLPATAEPDPAERALGDPTGQLTAAEGAALRALRAVLFEHDPARFFGGMRRVQGPSGDFLWVCDNHHAEYDPGLPTVP